MNDSKRIKELETRITQLEEFLSEIIQRVQYEIPGLITSIMAAEDDDEIIEIARQWAGSEVIEFEEEDYHEEEDVVLPEDDTLLN